MQLAVKRGKENNIIYREKSPQIFFKSLIWKTQKKDSELIVMSADVVVPHTRKYSQLNR